METLQYPLVAALALFAALVLALRRRRGAGRRLDRRARLLLLALSLSLSYAALEALFVFGLDTTDAFAQSRLSRRWFERHAGPPNALGLRDRDRPRGQPVPVVVLGDSFVWGNGVIDREDRVSGRLRAVLAERGRRLEVANCSHPGYDTRQEVDLLRRFVAAQGAPDCVVHVYVFNDAPASPDERDAAEALRPPEGLLGGVLSRSYSLDFLYTRAAFLLDPRLRSLRGLTAARYRDPEVLAAHEADLAALRAEVESGGGRYLLVSWPFHGGGGAFDHAYEWLAEFAARQGAPFCDLRATFAGRDADELVVGPFDDHPGPLAHDLAARAIAAELVERWPELGGDR